METVRFHDKFKKGKIICSTFHGENGGGGMGGVNKLLSLYNF